MASGDVPRLRAVYILTHGVEAPRWADEYWLRTMNTVPRDHVESLRASDPCCVFSDPGEDPTPWNGLCAHAKGEERRCTRWGCLCPHGATD